MRDDQRRVEVLREHIIFRGREEQIGEQELDISIHSSKQNSVRAPLFENLVSLRAKVRKQPSHNSTYGWTRADRGHVHGQACHATFYQGLLTNNLDSLVWPRFEYTCSNKLLDWFFDRETSIYREMHEVVFKRFQSSFKDWEAYKKYSIEVGLLLPTELLEAYCQSSVASFLTMYRCSQYIRNWSEELVKEYEELCDEHGVLLITAIFSELRFFNGASHAPFYNLLALHSGYTQGTDTVQAFWEPVVNATGVNVAEAGYETFSQTFFSKYWSAGGMPVYTSLTRLKQPAIVLRCMPEWKKLLKKYKLADESSWGDPTVCLSSRSAALSSIKPVVAELLALYNEFKES